MDENKYLILVKSEDKTAQVHSYEITKSVVRITYRNSSMVYEYASKNFIELKDPHVMEITEQLVVYKDDFPLYKVNRILDFGPKVRILFSDGKSCVCDKASIKVERNSITNGTSQSLMKYWTTISQYTKNTEEEQDRDAFLKTQFDKLTFVSSRSVLDCYLKGQPVRIDSAKIYETIFPFKFNISQKEALDNALRSRISIIEGPPGTGKTQTILNILANLAVMQKKTVAVVSGNNAAVQNVRDKLEAEHYNFLVAALGNEENKKQFFANPPQQDVSDWKSDTEECELIAQIHELNGRIHHLMEVDKKRAKLQQKLSAFRLERDHFEMYYDKQDVEEIRKLSFYRQTPEKILSFLVDNHVAIERGKTGNLLHKLKLVLRHGFTDFKRLQNNEIDVVLSFQRKYYEMKVEQLSQQMEVLRRELEQASFKSLLQQHQQTSQQLFRHKLFLKYHERQPMMTNAGSYKKNFAMFIDQYPIILSTTHSLRNCVPDNFLFDYVIIDESSQVDLLTGALALSCCKNVIIVGDTKQLPQIIDNTIEEKLGGMWSDVGEGYDYFRHNLLSSMLTLYGDAVPKVILKEHYRCHPKIIEFCNQKYYNGELIIFTLEGENDQPLIIYHTAEGNHMRELTHNQKGKFNQRELDVIQQEVLEDQEFTNQSYFDIGFMTPYRKQVEKANCQLSEEIESDTIHKYQGREKPTMILSTVLDRSRRGKMGMKFVNDPRKINVAVSRAQQRFILVTDKMLFRKNSSELGDLIRYMEYSTLDNNIVESEIVSVFDLLYKEYSEKLKDFKGRVIQRSKYASENIMRTLLSEILQEDAYSGLDFGEQVLVRNLLKDMEKLGDQERRYVNNRASVDFVLYHKLNKWPVLVIEVDGFAFHENDPQQLARDQLKDRILDTYGLPLLRLPTTGSGEEQRIRIKLDGILNK